MTGGEAGRGGAMIIRGARTHNLRDLDLELPHGAFIVCTGVSGSGKSSLAFDTLFVEGRRQYLEGLATHTRRALRTLPRADVDFIDGMAPTLSVAVPRRRVGRRSTVGTLSEVYHLVQVLFARAGTLHCPDCRVPISRQTREAIESRILALPERTRLMLLAPLVRQGTGDHAGVFERITREGYVRARVDGELVETHPLPQVPADRPVTIEAIVDRVVMKPGLEGRVQESVGAALRLAEGRCLVSYEADGGWRDLAFSTHLVCPQCQREFAELDPTSLSFNSARGACPRCQGLGGVTDRNGDGNAPCPVCPCPVCGGSRLSEIAAHVEYAGWNVPRLVRLSVDEAAATVEGWRAALPEVADGAWRSEQEAVAARVLPDLQQRLRFLREIGLGYLSLDRAADTLSGGELQRVRLAACLGNGLTGVCYLLDEPTSGLHAREVGRLLDSLRRLQADGNTLIVVEHDLQVIRQADWVVELGPGAGRHGGRLLAAGPPAVVAATPDSPTGRYLALAPAPTVAGDPPPDRWLTLSGVTVHNLQDVTAAFPLGRLVAVTGVSGSGKSSLVRRGLVPALRHRLGTLASAPAGVTLTGGEELTGLVEVDQQPLGRSSRSTPASHAGVWDLVRQLYTRTKEARLRGYGPSRFSYLHPDGRCPTCLGLGVQRVDLDFLPDVEAPCPDCGGSRFNPQTLAVTYRGKTVADVLRMQFDEAATFFDAFEKIARVLRTFCELGLGYLQLGQPATTLSGGEAQRIKLATELARPSSGGPRCYLLDEPTAGLHAADVDLLLAALRRLVAEGHTVIVVEHHLALIAASDWLVELGPGAGPAGGRVIGAGPPRTLAEAADTPTGQALRERGL